MPRLPGSELLSLLSDAIPSDHARQALADDYIAAATDRPEGAAWRVLDLGCGDGRSVDAFRACDPNVEWTGVDIEGSPEVRERKRDDATFVSFDGEHLPFADESFDLIFCKQVLEHVPRIEPLLSEAQRCLAPDGRFVGSTSQLEAYHSYSTANPTPYGLSLALRRAGLEVLELRPGIDGLTLVSRRLFARTTFFERWWTSESPLNMLLEVSGRLMGADPSHRNAAKLLFCGQFTFVAGRAR